MHRSRLRVSFALALLLATGCTSSTTTGVLAASRSAAPGGAEVLRGEYLATLLGCAACHTDGALTSLPTGPAFAGSMTGIAYSGDPVAPAVVFPSNLTPDPATGVGRWNQAQLARAIRHGIGADSQPLNTVMPWANYSLLKPDDAQAIAAFLLSLQPLKRQIPSAIAEGTVSQYPFVRIGVYRFEPDGS